MKKKPITLEDAHKMLDEQFQQARQQPLIEKPLAWALYQVWRDVDAEEERNDGRERETDRAG